MTLTQVTTISPPAKGLDFVSAPVSETQLRADGCTFVILYICRPNETHMAKVATPARIKRLHDAGIAVLLNYEASGTESRLGAPRGLSDGMWCRDFARSLGYPESLPILCSSFDTDVRPFIDAATAYGQAFADGASPYHIGIYGGTPIITRLAARLPLGWKAMAHAWSPFGFFPVIHIEQTVRVYNAGADQNICRLPFSAWLPSVQPDPTPTPTPPPANSEDLDTMISAPDTVYDTTDKANPDGVFIVGDPNKSSRSVTIASTHTRAFIVVTPIPVSGAGHLRISNDGHEPVFSTAQWQEGHPPMPLGLLVDLNGAGRIDIYTEGLVGSSCDLIIARTHVNG